MEIYNVEQPHLERDAKRVKRGRNPLIINFFVQGCVTSQPSGTWSYPGDVTSNYNKLSYWLDLAKKAEAARVNAIFIADVYGSYDVYKGPRNYKTGLKAGTQHPGIAAETAITAMASVTKSLGFGITFSTISEHPYHFARRLGSLDHLTDGRVGWNIVSSYLPSASRNLLNGKALPEKLTRYRQTDEYVQVVSELLQSSFRLDAVKKDKKTITYCDPNLVREINFKGEFYTVPGPSYTEPSPQGIPVLFQAGTSAGGIELAAKAAEVVFCDGFSPEILNEKVAHVKTIAKEKYGRDPSLLKFLTFTVVIVGKTHQEAIDKFEDLANHADHEGALALIGGWTGVDYSQYDDDVDLLKIENEVHRGIVSHFTRGLHLEEGEALTKAKFARFCSVKGFADLVIGSVEEVADELQKWVEVGGIDGFNFAPSTIPGSFEDLVDLVLPELRRRGLAWDDYPVKDGTLRENLYGKQGQTLLPEGHPYNKYIWKTGSSEEFGKNLQSHKDWLQKQQGDAFVTKK